MYAVFENNCLATIVNTQHDVDCRLAGSRRKGIESYYQEFSTSQVVRGTCTLTAASQMFLNRCPAVLRWRETGELTPWGDELVWYEYVSKFLNAYWRQEAASAEVDV